MRQVTKAEFVTYYEEARLTNILSVGNWVLAMLDEGTENAEAIYTQV